jgi:hypothetical protein
VCVSGKVPDTEYGKQKATSDKYHLIRKYTSLNFLTHSSAVLSTIGTIGI